VKLWVDDCKPCPDGFAVARTYDDALAMCRRFEYDAIYLDHDLGESRTGYDLLLQLHAIGRLPPRVEVISWNPVGRARIIAALKEIAAGIPSSRCTVCGHRSCEGTHAL